MESIKAQKIWFCWNYKVRKGKKTKVPISANGETTGTNEPYAHTWVAYSEAEAAAREHEYDGVGFATNNVYVVFDGQGTLASIERYYVPWQ